MNNQQIDDAFNSMLRTDYIPLKDTNKLNRLAQYYVDYYGFLSQILSENDQLIVGRRGTGKTTLLYRALVECMRSWGPAEQCAAKPRTLAIYLDLGKCQALADVTDGDFDDFEHVFASELCDAMREEIGRSWPAVNAQPGLFSRLFKSAEEKQAAETKRLLGSLAAVLKSGVPRIIDQSGAVETRDLSRAKKQSELSGSGKLSDSPALNIAGKRSTETTVEQEEKSGYRVSYRLTISDILRILGELRNAAEIPSILLLIDEFSALSEDLQRRFTTLLKKILGNHSGLFVKLCAITDNYRLGSSIILQRDLFELSLDLDAFVERSGSLNAAMSELESLTERIVKERIKVYAQVSPRQIFEEPIDAWRELSRSAMGVPRTLGIVLKQAWSRALTANRKMQKSDIDYGIRYASKAYVNQLEGAARDGLAIPEFAADIWEAILNRAVSERSKVDAPASHFMVLPKTEVKLKYLSMFFVVHLLTKGRTTKKEKLSRSLYCIDYGICLENNLSFATDKNILRQQRFAYDDELAGFDAFFEKEDEPKYICSVCKTVYRESELRIRGKVMAICVEDQGPLRKYELGTLERRFTEEEIKIIGSIRSSLPADHLIARQVADDVGCNIQKVSKFGEKLEREGIIERERIEELQKNIYYGPDLAPRANDLDKG
jgi:hypothetical protein